MANKPQWDLIAEAFVNHYYSVFDTDRSQLATLYRDVSMLTFEGTACMGASAITQKLVSLPFQKVRHHVVTCDAQPVLPESLNGVLVFVNGDLTVDDGAQAIKFAQVFHLLPDRNSPGLFWVYNDLFRLNYG
ncbi:Nuclear transport factor 2 [Cyanidiococcus yangmingshanensis]|uniref:NTF2-related export protein n=1 Tax=Cyanidiococcus yangmingshanensis TaxID=2690220 RepID=A0A7J7IQJ2_9RHOD|nr:Nuclear transport factor 2 [Cyanidiococcus yangmingshanensis]